MNAFFAMGGYAPYIWPSYGLSLLVILALVLVSVSAHKKAKALVRRLEGEETVDPS